MESSILAGLIFTSSGREPGLTWTGMGSKFLEQYQMAVSDLQSSRVLGHNGGSALAMKTYGHLRNEHSQAMAEKVKF